MSQEHDFENDSITTDDFMRIRLSTKRCTDYILIENDDEVLIAEKTKTCDIPVMVYEGKDDRLLKYIKAYESIGITGQSHDEVMGRLSESVDKQRAVAKLILPLIKEHGLLKIPVPANVFSFDRSSVSKYSLLAKRKSAESGQNALRSVYTSIMSQMMFKSMAQDGRMDHIISKSELAHIKDAGLQLFKEANACYPIDSCPIKVPDTYYESVLDIMDYIGKLSRQISVFNVGVRKSIKKKTHHENDAEEVKQDSIHEKMIDIVEAINQDQAHLVDVTTKYVYDNRRLYMEMTCTNLRSFYIMVKNHDFIRSTKRFPKMCTFDLSDNILTEESYPHFPQQIMSFITQYP